MTTTSRPIFTTDSITIISATDGGIPVNLVVDGRLTFRGRRVLTRRAHAKRMRQVHAAYGRKRRGWQA